MTRILCAHGYRLPAESCPSCRDNREIAELRERAETAEREWDKAIDDGERRAEAQASNYLEERQAHAATRAEADRAGECQWVPSDGGWKTSCGHMYIFETGGPTENRVVYCCYCGKRLAEGGS